MEYNYFVDLSNPLLIIFVVMTTIGTTVSAILDWLNTRKDNLREKLGIIHSFGEDIKKMFPMSKMEKSLKYESEWNNFSNMRDGITSSIVSVCTIFGVFPFLIQFFLRLFPSVGIVWAAVLSSATVYLVSTLVNIPFGYYSNFTLEEKYGFNNMTVGTFIRDTLKSTIIGLAVITISKHLVNFGLVKFGNLSLRDIFLFSAGIVLCMKVSEYFYETVGMVLFNKFSPVGRKSLANKIFKLCEKTKFNVKRVLVMDESKRSRHSNAFVCGVFRKKIVLFDTLLENFTDDEILSIVAHEIGHWKKRHLLLTDLISAVTILFNTTAVFLLIKNVGLYHAFGYRWVNSGNLTENLILGFPLALGFVSACTWFLTPLGSWVSRKMEYQADAFAAKLVGKGPSKSSLFRLYSQDLGDPFPNKAYESWYYSHPSVVNRVKAVESIPDELCPNTRKPRKSPGKKNTAKKTPENKPARRKNYGKRKKAE